jgi:hypothetical protein
MTHDYERVTWDCGTCGEQWPCAPAKVELAEQHPDPIDLEIHMLRLMKVASIELPLSACGYPELRDRFVTWTERR